MSENFDRRGADAPRMRWNDIRIVGPVLVAMLVAVSLLSPTFAGADQSVGSVGDGGDPRLECFRYRYVEKAPPTDGLTTSFSAAAVASDCCDAVDLIDLGVGGLSISELCPPAPARDFFDPPPPIMGPIWLGATTASAPEGLIVLDVPTLLGMFIEGNEIEVTNSDGDVVRVGRLSRHDTLATGVAYAGGTVELTIKTRLKTGAVYTEEVSFAAPIN